MRRNTYIIVIDEAGRGPLAGPVVVAAIRAPRAIGRILRRRGIRDSKKLSAKRREEWFQFLVAHPYVEWAVARVWPRIIDRINISRAANRAAFRVYKKLSGGRVCLALLDGGLRLPAYIPQKTIIRGDEKIPVIAAASIIAKVTRDLIMIRLHKKYPRYRFDIHKGYGTELHRALIKKYGRADAHRKSFRVSLPKKTNIVLGRHIWRIR